MRIAVVGISYEALLRSPVPTPTMEVEYGEEMIGRNLWMVRGIEQRFSEADGVELVPILMEAGDSGLIPGEMKHNEIATSDDVEILELSVPGPMGTTPCEPPAGMG